jgi:D-3-phosphoglycerate dehydrogenase
LVDGAVREVKIEYSGEIVDLNAAPVTRSFLAGLLRDVSARVNAVNAFLIAEERGIAINTTYVRSASDSVPAIRTHVLTSASEQSLSGTLFGYGEQSRQGRITELNGFPIEAIPQGYMLVMRNQDVPGVIGRVGTTLGERGVNISRFHLGRRERGGEALALIETDAPLSDDAIEELLSFTPVISALQIEL